MYHEIYFLVGQIITYIGTISIIILSVIGMCLLFNIMINKLISAYKGYDLFVNYVNWCKSEDCKSYLQKLQSRVQKQDGDK